MVSTLFNSVDHLNYLLSDVDCGCYHVSTRRNAISFIELLRFSVGNHHPIGGDPDFLDVVSKMGMDLQAVVNQVVGQQLNDPTSVVRRGVVDGLVARTNQAISRVKPSDSMIVPYDLTPIEQTKITHYYPEIRLEFSSRPNAHPHAMSAALRMCETQVALLKMCYRSDSSSPNHVAFVKDIGGNFVSHLDRGRENIHSCCPVLSARDSMRNTDRALKVAAIMNNPRKQKLATKLRDPTF